MSIYAVNKVCRKLFHETAFRKELEADPAGTLARMGVSEEEARLMRAGEVGRLYEMGAHPFLLGHLTRHNTFGITFEAYARSIWQAKDDRLPPLEPAEYMKQKAG